MEKSCDFPELDFRRDSSTKNKTDEDFMSLFCNHVKHIRKFGLEHTTLSLVEFAIEELKILMLVNILLVCSLELIQSYGVVIII